MSVCQSTAGLDQGNGLVSFVPSAEVSLRFIILTSGRSVCVDALQDRKRCSQILRISSSACRK
jgi:hypothetical protein